MAETQTPTSETRVNPNAKGNGPLAYDQITIQGLVFRVPIRYSVGDVLKTEGEASALNQTLHENIRNNMAKKVAEGQEAGLPHATLQQQVDDYATDYQFGVRTGGGGYRGDPVMTLAMNTAREMIRQAIKEKKLDEDEWPASRITQVAKALLEQEGEDGKIMQTARQTIEAERAAAKSAMSSVLELIKA